MSLGGCAQTFQHWKNKHDVKRKRKKMVGSKDLSKFDLSVESPEENLFHRLSGDLEKGIETPCGCGRASLNTNINLAVSPVITPTIRGDL